MRRRALILTILNEAGSLPALLDSLLAQTQIPDEIILVDGGSRDDSLGILRAYQDRLPLTIIESPGCNISQGRNLAIQAANSPIIAVTDAGVRLVPSWFQTLTAPLLDDSNLSIIAGFFQADPDPKNPFQVAMSAAVLPLAEEIKPAGFLPSSRSVAFRKAAWAAVGGYPEWLDYCEDLIFDLRLQARYGPFQFVPQASVGFRPRTSLRSFYKQYYLYARGDGKADLWRKRHAIRYATYLLALPALIFAGLGVHPAAWLLLLLGGLLYLKAPYQRLPRLWGELGPLQKAQAALYIPLIRLWGDVAKMQGYPVGCWWRWQNAPPNWRKS
jgi:glycosyltransferase involved in cell wall biosynthesis